MPKVTVYSNQSELNKGLTAFIIRLLEDKPTLTMALSGGSTPKAVFDYWAGECAETIPWDRIHFYWGDERCVPPEDEMSNYGMTKEHLFNRVSVPEENIHRIWGEAEPEREAARYGSILPPSLDVILLGMGEDGHTASIFPYNLSLWDSVENCVVAAHPDTGMLRVSCTGRVINAAQHVAFLVTGKSKAEKVRDILDHPSACFDRYPAARVNPASGKLFWFVDKEAMGEG